MWFKNLLVYRLAPEWNIDLNTLNDQLAARPLQRCGNMDMESRGWVYPRHEGQFVHAVNGQWLLALGHEQKLLPASIVNQFAKDKAAEIAEQQDAPVSRKQMREIKERVTEELLPRAFARRRTTWVWIDPINRWLVVDASSEAKGEEVIEALRKTLETLPVRRFETVRAPLSAMTGWVASGEAPAGFTIDQDLELRANDEGKATIRYVRHALEGKEIQDHIAGGKMATRLAMTWSDRISFVLNEQLQVKRLAFLDVLKEQAEAQSDDAEQEFDINFTLMAGEVAQLLADLITALDGEAPPRG